MLLHSFNSGFFFFPFYCQVICIFVKSVWKKIKKIKKSAMGFPQLMMTLCGHSTCIPDKQLNRQVLFFYEFFFNDEVPRLVEL